MGSVFKQIEQAMIDALKQPLAVCTEIGAKRDHGLPAEIEQAVYVRRQRGNAERGAIAGAPVDWTSNFVVECYARGNAQTADELLDALFAKVYARLAADSTLGGLVMDCFLTDCQWSDDALDQRLRMVAMVYQVEHRTNNLTVE